MNEGISPVELLAQLRSFVMLLSAPAQDQIAWLISKRMPVDELHLQLDDAAPGWFERLRANNLISPEAEASLLSLLDHLRSMGQDVSLWSEHDALNSPVWETVRQRAHQTLAELDFPEGS